MRSANCIAPQGIVVGRKWCDAALHARITVKKPITGVACAARAVSGHAPTALSPATNFRRRILDPSPWINDPLS